MNIRYLRLRLAVISICVFLHGCGMGDLSSVEAIRERLFTIGDTQDELSKRASIFRLNSNLGLDDQVGSLLHRQFGDERWKAMSTTNLIRTSALKINAQNFSLTYDNVPICNAQIKVHQFPNTGHSFAFSHLPSPEASLRSDRQIDSADLPNLLRSTMVAQEISDSDFEMLDEKDCYFADKNGDLIRSKEVLFSADDLSYKAIVSADRVISMMPNFFDVTGKAKVYTSNPADGRFTNFTLEGLVSDGSLENDYFTTSTTGTKAEEDDHIFNYSPSDGRFDETSLFVHANEQLSFFKDLGYKWSGDDKINIFVHAVVNGSVNNALYTPASGVNPPKIQVGDGDGVRLKNLPKDADVVRHELGHHIVYDTLKSTRGESLVMHEGLADFFAFAFSGDACLGESICPEDSPLKCEVEKECLRSADNDYVLNKNTKPEAHFKSQFVSGMLWDLRDEIDESKLTQIVFDGVSLLLDESGYHDLVLGLLIAEDESDNGKYCQKIYDAATARGLESYIADFGCGDDLPALSALDNAGGETEGVTAVSKRSGGNQGGLFNCGMVGSEHHQMPSLALLLTGLMAPLLLRRKKQG